MQDKPDYFYNQSAALPYRFEVGRLQVLVVTNRKKKRWIIPKGIIEEDLSASESAAREALEEAGVEGRIAGTAVGTYTYRKWRGVCTVRVFPLRVDKVLDRWPEDYLRERRWLSPDEAAGLMAEEELARIIRALPDLIDAPP